MMSYHGNLARCWKDRFRGRALLTLLAVVLLFHPNAAAAQSAADFSTIGTQIKSTLVYDNVPAMAVAVAHRGRIVWEQGFGWADRERHVSATANTPFYLASVTKSFTSTAIMVLQQDGSLNLDKPVNNYLGGAKVHSPLWNAEDATVRLVATHMSGLTTFYRACNIGDKHCQISIRQEIERYGILFWPPGERFDYSNLGYAVLGEVAAHISRDSFGHFLQARVFHPLGMSYCSLDRPLQAAANYDQYTHHRTADQVSGSPGASAAYCSAHDLALFAMFHLKDHLRSQRRILGDAALDELHRPVTALRDQQYAMGWWTSNRGRTPVVFGQGGTSDSFTLVELFPAEDVAIVLLANSWSDDLNMPNEIEKAILAQVLPQIRPESPPAEEQRPVLAMSPGLTGRWSGHVATLSGNVPVVITISRSAEASGHVGSAADSELKSLSIRGEHVYGILPADLGEDDAPPRPYDVEFDLFLRGNQLVGAATTRPDPTSSAQLPHWVELQAANVNP